MAKIYVKNTDGTYTPQSSVLVSNLDIVQDKGDSLISAMSQKAVTDELKSKQDTISDLEIIRSNAKNASDIVTNMTNAGYLFAGVAIPSTDPGTPDAKVFYIANGKGTYTNFGSLEVTEDDVVVFYWDTLWHKVSTGISREEKLTNLGKEIATKQNALTDTDGGYGQRVAKLEKEGTASQEKLTELGQETTKAIDDTIIGEILQNGQLAVLEGNGIERVTEIRSGFINKNGNLVEHTSFQTAIINVANNKAYKIYAPQAGSESIINRLHLFAEENGGSPICGSYLVEYLSNNIYAVFPPKVKSISVTTSINTTLSILEYDIANSKTFSFFNSKTEELGQAISDVKQTYGEVIDTTPKYESVEGVVYNGKIQVITAYPNGFHSKPFWCKRGDVITITQRRNSYALSALYKTDESESYFETLIHGTASQNSVTKECYIQKDGWYGVSGRTNSFIFAKKSISDGYILKATSKYGVKKTIDLTITNNDIVIGDAPLCPFIGSRAYSIKGNGNKTISISLSETPTGRCFSVGLRIPYATQDVAKVTINGLSYSMASSDARTASGKSYMMEGDHYHRYNFDTRYKEINSFDIVVESEADWEIMLSANCIVDDEMDCCPVMIGYDLTEQYNGYFDYNGESINVYELHKRLNIPYYVAISKGTVITIQEVQDAIDSGLAEVVFYSGGPAMTPLWNKTDGSFAEKLWQDKCAVGIDVDMNVLSQAVIDRNIYRNLKNAGFKILRHLSQNAGKFSAIADKYGDNDIYISYGYGLGTSAIVPNQLRFPLIMYSHGIGVSNIPDDPYYPSHYVDFDGTKTIDTFMYLKSQEEVGEVKCLKPSDWFAYIKGCRVIR